MRYIAFLCLGAASLGSAQLISERWTTAFQDRDWIYERDGSGWFLTKNWEANVGMTALGPGGAVLWTSATTGIIRKDRYGNLFVGNHYKNFDNTYTATINKIDKFGNKLLVASYPGFIRDFDVDYFGRLHYVRMDGSVLQINANGAEHTITGLPYISDAYLKVDTAGNIYVLGTGGTLQPSNVHKISPTGQVLWSRQFSSYHNSIELAPVSGVLVHGGKNNEEVTYRVASNGTVMWDRVGEKPFVTKSNRILLQQETMPQAMIGNLFLNMYNANGVVQWSKHLGTLDRTQGEVFAVDNWENSYAWASVRQGLSFTSKLIKVDANGNVVWEKIVGTNTGGFAWHQAAYSQDTGDILFGITDGATCYRQAPIANPDSFVMSAGATLQGAVGTNDQYAAEAAFNIVDPPSSGSLLMLKGGKFSYTPANGFTGTLTFTYKALKAGVSDSPPATVTIQVN